MTKTLVALLIVLCLAAAVFAQDTPQQLTPEQQYNLEHFGDINGPQFGDGAEQPAEQPKTTPAAQPKAEPAPTKQEPAKKTEPKKPKADYSAATWLKAYDQYQGIFVLTSMMYGKHWVEPQKKWLRDNFCAATGIRNCLVSQICSRVVPIQADNSLVGVGKAGEVMASAALTAERSLPLIVEGMSKRELIELFGGLNQTTIAGRTVNFNDPDFDPSILGPMSIRLYHIQWGITNYAPDEKDLRWNIEFRTAGGLSRKWYPQDMILEHGQTVTCNNVPGCHRYKLTATTYDTACLLFSPGLPSGAVDSPIAGKPRYVRELCVPIVEYEGGPTSVAAASGGTAPGGGQTGTTVEGTGI